MNEEDVKLLILRYLDDGFEDTEYIAKIVNSFPFVKTAALICELLRSSDYEIYSMTGLFLRDAILYGNRNEACNQFIADYPESSIVKTLEEFVFSDNYTIQHQAIYTLAKTCSYSSKYVFRQAFDLYRDSDPLLLHQLVSEMGWLGVEDLENCIEQMANSSSYLTRWAAVGHIYHRDAIFPDWVERLRRDNCEFICAEAEYECQRITKSVQTSILSKLEQRQRAKEIKKLKPKISFWAMSMQFRHYLSNNDLSKYTVADLEAYIDRAKLEGWVMPTT
jgi:hypothetical protein